MKSVFDYLLEDLRGRNGITPQIMQDLRDRDSIGFLQHGKPLLFDDKRNWGVEGYQECLDLAVYTRANTLTKPGWTDIHNDAKALMYKIAEKLREEGRR